MAGKAETKGFEPLIRFPVYTLSRRAPSTTRTSLLTLYLGYKGLQKYWFRAQQPNNFLAFCVVLCATCFISTFFISANLFTTY